MALMFFQFQTIKLGSYDISKFEAKGLKPHDVVCKKFLRVLGQNFYFGLRF